MITDTNDSVKLINEINKEIKNKLPFEFISQ